MNRKIYQTMAKLAVDVFANMDVKCSTYTLEDVIKLGDAARLLNSNYPDEQVELTFGSFRMSFPKSEVFRRMKSFEPYIPMKDRVKFVKRNESEITSVCTFTIFPKYYHKNILKFIPKKPREEETRIYIDIKKGNVAYSSHYAVAAYPVDIEVDFDNLGTTTNDAGNVIDEHLYVSVSEDLWKAMINHKTKISIIEDKEGYKVNALLDNGSEYNEEVDSKVFDYGIMTKKMVPSDSLIQVDKDEIKGLFRAVKGYRISFGMYFVFKVQSGDKHAFVQVLDTCTESVVLDYRVELAVKSEVTTYFFFDKNQFLKLTDWNGRIIQDSPNGIKLFGSDKALALILPCIDEPAIHPYKHVWDKSESVNAIAILTSGTKLSQKNNQVEISKTPSKEKETIIMSATTDKQAIYSLERIKSGDYVVSQKSETEGMNFLIRSIAHYILQRKADNFNDPEFTMQADFCKAFVDRAKADNATLPLTEDQLACYMANALIADLGIKELPEYTIEQLDAPIQPAEVKEPAKQDAIIPEQKATKRKTKVKSEPKAMPAPAPKEEPKEEPKLDNGVVRKLYDNISATYQDSVILFRNVIDGYYAAIFNDATLLGQYLGMEINTKSGFPMICVECQSLESTIRTIMDKGQTIIFLDWEAYMPTEVKEEPKQEETLVATTAPIAEPEPEFKIERKVISFGNRMYKALSLTSGDSSLTIAPLLLYKYLTDKNDNFVSDKAEEIFNEIDAFIQGSLIEAEELDMKAICDATESFLSLAM